MTRSWLVTPYASRLSQFQPTVQSPEQAADVLESEHPVWLLWPDATIRAANQLAAWLWGYLPRAPDATAGVTSTDSMLSRNAMSVIRENLSRIPLERNTAFALANLALIQNLSASHARPRPCYYGLAHDLYERRHDLIALYQSDPPQPEQVYHYELKIKSPERLSRTYLHFETVVEWVFDRTAEPGMIVEHRPLRSSKRTLELLAEVHEHITSLGKSGCPYVRYAGEPDEATAPPEPRIDEISSLRRAVLSRPVVSLLLDRSEASRRALDAFDRIRVRFNAQPVASGGPAVKLGGQRYSGIAKVLQVVEALRQFDEGYGDALRATTQDALGHRDNQLLDWLEAERQGDVERGRAIVDGRPLSARPNQGGGNDSLR